MTPVQLFAAGVFYVLAPVIILGGLFGAIGMIVGCVIAIVALIVSQDVFKPRKD